MGLRFARSRPFFLERFAWSGLAITSSNACTIWVAAGRGTPRTACTCWLRCVRLGGTDTTDENAFEEFASTAACSTIHVSGDRVFEQQPRGSKNFWVEIPRIVDDDHDRCISPELPRGVGEHSGHVCDVST